MIEVKVIDDIFIIKGSFDLGIAGIYTNQEFSSEQIQILESYQEVVEDYLGKKYFWGILAEYLKKQKLTEESVSQAISQYYNALEQKAQLCIKQINSNFLINVFEDMIGCGLGFWEIEGAYIKEKMPTCQKEAYGEVIYQPYWDETDALYKEYNDTPNDNSLEKTDVEKRLREIFPMFDMDAFIRGVRPEILTLHGEYVSFQCSDSWKCQILCSAYDNLDERFTFTDWHNF